MTTPACPDCPSYAGYRFPTEIIGHAVWLYFRFSLSLRNVDETLAARGIVVSHETVRQWLRARNLPGQRGEAAIAIAALNTMIRTAKLASVRVA